MIGYHVLCYRCRLDETGDEDTERRARERVVEFQRDHRGSCGMGASFSISIYTTVPTRLAESDG